MSPTSPIIETPRLRLQALSVEEHVEDLHKIFSNQLAMQWMPSFITETLDQTKSMLQQEVPSPERPWIRTYVITPRPTSQDEEPHVVGKIGAFPQMACYLHPDFWRKGYATEAARALLENYWASRDHLHEDEISVAIDARNVASLILAEKLGFRKGETCKETYGIGNITMYHASRPVAMNNFIETVGKEQVYVVKTERFWMQHLSIEDHLQDYHEMWLCPETSKFIRGVEKHTLESSLAFLTRRVRSTSNPYVQNLAILEPPAPNASPNTKLKFIGAVGCTRFPSTFTATNHDPGEPEVGYAINPQFCGKGYATEALKAYLEYYWSILEAPHAHVKSIMALYSVANVASGRVLEKAGFKEREVIKDFEVQDRMKIEAKICWVQRPS